MGKKGRHPRHEEPSSEDDEDEVMVEDIADGEELGTSDFEDDQDVGPEDGEGIEQTAVPKKKKGSQRPEREPIYDVDGMHEKLEDFGWAEPMTWDETQVITNDDPSQIENVDDDIARELTFYNQALSAAQAAITKFDSTATPWLRPQDYYAEMVKSDEHMAKVKEQLMHEQRLIEQAEERRKAREAKQYSKQVQADKQKERNAAKKRQIDEVSKLRKQREKSGFAGNMDFDAELAAMERGAPSQQQGGKRGGFRDRQQGDRHTPGKKRQARDAKFGFGGSKRLKKQNDAYSAAAVDGFKQGRFSEHFSGKGPSKGGAKGKHGPGGVKKQQMKRPGKNARAAKASKKGSKK